MDRDFFIEKVIEQLQDHDGSPITMDTVFRNIPAWDSLTGMAVQLMIQDDMNAPISDEDFINAKTIGDLYELMLKNKK